jgi:hypothetical protein
LCCDAFAASTIAPFGCATLFGCEGGGWGNNASSALAVLVFRTSSPSRERWRSVARTQRVYRRCYAKRPRRPGLRLCCAEAALLQRSHHALPYVRIWEQPHLLPGSKSQHYRDFDAAVRRLAGALLDQLRPAARPEHPRPPAQLYGYTRTLAQPVGALEQGRSVALSGPGGVGKTSLGATALRELAGRGSFWYTLRPCFNDGVGSLLFALGAFLHERGVANLWRYLVAINGQVDEMPTPPPTTSPSRYGSRSRTTPLPGGLGPALARPRPCCRGQRDPGRKAARRGACHL